MTLTAPSPTSPTKRPLPPLPTPAPLRLLAPHRRRTVEMRLTHLSASIHIAALSAEITLLLTFHNPHSRELQGELLFPLPENATISAYGIDIDGQIVDASLVEKHKARVAFETEVRRPKIIDPGLAEHAAGNLFRTRIYPLPPKGDRQIKLQYVTSLTHTDAGPLLDVPLPSTGPLDRLHLHVAVSSPNAPTLISRAWTNAGFTRDGDRFVADLERRNTEPDSLRIILPDTRTPLVSIEPLKSDPTETYFSLHHRLPDLPPEPITPPSALRILWDASLSRASADLQRDFDLLRDVLARFQPPRVELTTFRHMVEPPQTFGLRDDQPNSLLNHLRSLPNDGATSAVALHAALTQPPPDTLTLLFTDGLATLDEDPTAIVSKASNPASPLHVINSSPTANHPLLHHLAHHHGGQYLNLKHLHPELAASRITHRPLRFLSCDVLEGQVADLQPAPGIPVHESFTLTGRLLSPRAQLRLHFGHTHPTYSIDCTLDASTAHPGRIVPRLWAQQRAQSLSLDPQRHAPDLLSLGRKFSLATPNTSLLVLETLWQHLSHDVEPAITRVELYKAFHEQRARSTSPSPGPQPPRLHADENTRRQLLAFYANLRAGDTEGGATDVDWLTAHTEGFTAEQIVSLVDGAVFLAKSHGRHRPTRDDFIQSAYNVAKRPLAEPPHAPAWRGLLAWHRNAYSLPKSPAKTLLPDKPWDLSDSDGQAMALLDTRASRSRTIDKTLDSMGSSHSIDRSIDLATLHHSSSATPNHDESPTPPWSRAQIPPDFPDERTAESEYLRQRSHHATDPTFYQDWSRYFLSKGWRPTALRILSNLAELEPKNVPHLRALAYHLESWSEHRLAQTVYAQILRLRPEEPQSHRDLALSLAATGDPADTRRAIHLLSDVVHGHWDDRFRPIQTTALLELNALLQHHHRTHPHDALDIPLPPDQRQPLDLDLRIVLDWNQDMTDLDLWVTERTGELASGFSSPSGISHIGGYVPADLSQGYGPEEYLLRHAPPGPYRIQVRHAGTFQRRLPRPATIKVTLIHDFARPTERREVLVSHIEHHRPKFSAPKEWGCLVISLGFLMVPLILITRSPWLTAIGVAALSLLSFYFSLLDRIARRHRLHKNVSDVTTLTVPAIT